MSRPRFLADHDLNEQLISGLVRREPKVEFRRAREVGLDKWNDERILRYAAAHGFLVVSHDVNTMTSAARQRIARGEEMAGLLMVHQLDPIEPNIESLLLIWSASDAEEWRDRIGFLPL